MPRMKPSRILITTMCLVMATLLSSCATTYHARGLAGGYSEIITSQDSFIVTFKGNEYTSTERVMQYALTRASELTIQNGYKYFYIVSSMDQTRGYSYSDTRSNVSESANTYHYWNSSTTGINASGSTSTYSGTVRKPGLSINIKCFKEKPNSVDVIDAAFFLANNKK
jgi:hypothetical protein